MIYVCYKTNIHFARYFDRKLPNEKGYTFYFTKERWKCKQINPKGGIIREESFI